jgi:hypothetical protein
MIGFTHGYEETRIDRRFALAYVCEQWHSGQWSRGYRLLCKLGVRWSILDHTTKDHLLPREEWEVARHFAAHYIRLVRNGDIQL